MTRPCSAVLALALLAAVPGRAAVHSDITRSVTVAAPTMAARLIDSDVKARERGAVVKVDVRDLEIVDPAAVYGKAAPGQGHLHYRLDDGPVIATTATRLSFHELASGTHTITVTLAGNDHAPLGPSETMTVTIP